MKVAARIAFASCILLLAAQLAACTHSDPGEGYRPIDTRTQAAQATASGVIAAAAERISSELEYYLPGDEFAGLRATLLDTVPESVSADPLRYEVEFLSDPESADQLTAIVTSIDAPDQFEVRLEWDEAGSRSVWRDGAYEEVAGDWTVRSAAVLAQ